MKINRSVPPATVVPMLVYPDVRAAVAFLTDAFGFVEHTRIGATHRAQLAVGDDGAVIVARWRRWWRTWLRRSSAARRSARGPPTGATAAE